MYAVRTKEGRLIGKIDNARANDWMQRIKGEFVKKNFKKGGEKICYVFKQDMEAGVQGVSGSILLTVFEDDYMCLTD